MNARRISLHSAIGTLLSIQKATKSSPDHRHIIEMIKTIYSLLLHRCTEYTHTPPAESPKITPLIPSSPSTQPRKQSPTRTQHTDELNQPPHHAPHLTSISISTPASQIPNHTHTAIPSYQQTNRQTDHSKKPTRSTHQLTNRKDPFSETTLDTQNIRLPRRNPLRSPNPPVTITQSQSTRKRKRKRKRKSQLQ